MNESTLLKEQVLCLREDQKQVISNYYRLVSNSLSSPPDIDEVIRIWEMAETDPKLCTWLEFIDFFFTQPPDDSSLLSENTRSYLSEYILSIVLQKHPDRTGIDRIFDASNFLRLNCPDGTGSLTLPDSILKSDHWEAFMNEPCHRCNRLFVEHEISFVNNDQDSSWSPT